MFFCLPRGTEYVRTDLDRTQIYTRVGVQTHREAGQFGGSWWQFILHHASVAWGLMLLHCPGAGGLGPGPGLGGVGVGGVGVGPGGPGAGPGDGAFPSASAMPFMYWYVGVPVEKSIVSIDESNAMIPPSPWLTAHAATELDVASVEKEAHVPGDGRSRRDRHTMSCVQMFCW